MHKSVQCLIASAVLGFAVLVSGAKSRAADAEAGSDVEADIKAAIDKLPEGNRAAALAQRWCAIEQGNRLGSMDVPVKVVLDGKPVFLCCAGCKKKATADAKGTVKTAESLKKINSALAKLTAADRSLAEGQRYCAVMNESRLGSMGAPVKLMLNGTPVFLCCQHCEAKAKANPKGTVAKAGVLTKTNASN